MSTKLTPPKLNMKQCKPFVSPISHQKGARRIGRQDQIKQKQQLQQSKKKKQKKQGSENVSVTSTTNVSVTSTQNVSIQTTKKETALTVHSAVNQAKLLQQELNDLRSQLAFATCHNRIAALTMHSTPTWYPAPASTLMALLNREEHSKEIDFVVGNTRRQLSSTLQVFSIYRIQNNALWKKYAAYRTKNQSQTVEICGFHGSRLNDPALIYKGDKGFDPAKSHPYNPAVWFAANASYSHSGYAHRVARPHLPFTALQELEDYDKNEAQWSNKPFYQLFFAQVCIPTLQYTQRLADSTNRTWQVKDKHSAYPTYLVTYSPPSQGY